MSILRIEYPPWAEDFLRPARYKGAWGGRGSGKSHTFATMLVEEHVADPNTKSVGVREIQKSLKMSSKQLIEDKIKGLGVGGMFNEQNDCIKRVDGDGIIIFSGLQDHTADSIKSLEGFDRAWVEEAQSISHSSLKKLRPTIRKPGSEIWATWNPENATDPIDELLRGADVPNGSVVRQVNWTDNPWFPDVLNDERLFDQKRDPELYRHVWEGEYLIMSRATVFNNWREEEFEAPKDAVLRFGCDFGYSQDPSVGVRCYLEGRKLYIEYEAYAIGCPIVELPELFFTIPEIEKWPSVGDSSRPETIRHLRDNGFPKMMPSVKGAGSVQDGVEFLRSFEIIVHPRCTHVINELKRYRYKVDPKTDKILPIFEDKHNHCVAEGSMVTTELNRLPIEDIMVGDKVLTRGGFERVSAVFDNGIRETMRIRTENETLICTPDHKVLTNRGWLRVDALRYDDLLLRVEVEKCEERMWSGEDSSTEDTLIQKENQTGTTLKDHFQEAVLFCIGTFGLITTAPFLMGITFTMWTETLPIMIFLIYAVLNQVSTSKSTGPMRGIRSSWNILIKFAHSLKSGMIQRQVGSGIVSTLKTPWQRLGKILSRKSASNAEGNFSAKLTEPVIDFAQANASQRGDGIKDWMMLTAHAKIAGERLESINTKKIKLVQERVLEVSGSGKRRVYDLSIENHREFVAENLLVENCIDALRYALEAVRRTGKVEKVDPVIPIPVFNKW